jgi:hypothetical protein
LAWSAVLFREQRVWARYKWAIVGSVAALIAQSLLIAGLLVSRVKRRRAERSVRESERRLRVLADSAPSDDSDVQRRGARDGLQRAMAGLHGRDIAAERGNGWLEGVGARSSAASPTEGNTGSCGSTVNIDGCSTAVSRV